MHVNLILQKKNGAHKTFHLTSGVTVIGRRQECDLCIPLMVISRRHCELNCDQNLLKIRDLGSRNGTYINGKRIEEETTISPGDEISVGPLSFIAQIEGKPEDLAASDSGILQPPGYLTSANSAEQFYKQAGEFIENPDQMDLNQTYSSSQISKSISEDVAGQTNDKP